MGERPMNVTSTTRLSTKKALSSLKFLMCCQGNKDDKITPDMKSGFLENSPSKLATDKPLDEFDIGAFINKFLQEQICRHGNSGSACVSCYFENQPNFEDYIIRRPDNWSSGIGHHHHHQQKQHNHHAYQNLPADSPDSCVKDSVFVYDNQSFCEHVGGGCGGGGGDGETTHNNNCSNSVAHDHYSYEANLHDALNDKQLQVGFDTDNVSLCSSCYYSNCTMCREGGGAFLEEDGDQDIDDAYISTNGDRTEFTIECSTPTFDAERLERLLRQLNPSLPITCIHGNPMRNDSDFGGNGTDTYYENYPAHNGNGSDALCCCQREESTTDTLSTEQSKNDKDSGVGRTDDSLKTEESSEQDLADCTSPTAAAGNVGGSYTHRSSNDSFTSHATTVTTEEGSTVNPTEDQLIKECDIFRQALEHRCGGGGGAFNEDIFRVVAAAATTHGATERVPEVMGENGLERVDSQSSLERELVALNREMKQIELECQQIVEAHKKETAKCIATETTMVPSPSSSQSSQDSRASPSRVVPRMGTRLDYAKQQQLQQEYPDPIWVMREPALTSTPVQQQKAPSPVQNGGASTGDRSKIIMPLGEKNAQQNGASEKGEKPRKSPKQKRGDSSCSSAYYTGDSCRNTPSMTLELESKSNGCLSHKQITDTQREHEAVSMDQSKCSVSKSMSNSSVNQITQTPEPPKGENLQEMYSQYADVMYTNQANLQHTIMLQQKLFQQKLSQQSAVNQPQRNLGSVQNGCHSSQNGYSSQKGRSSSKQNSPIPPPPQHYPENPQVASSRCEPAPLQSPYSSLRQMREQQNDSCGTNNANVAMEWVVKRRADGSRYITRRPMRSKMLKERAKKISEERCGMTTDDDAMSELKVGRYWSKDERKRHLEKAKEYKRRKAEMLRARMDTVRENEDQMKPSILELSQRKMMKHKSRKMYDDFTTVQEILAHGSRNSQAPSESGSHQSGVTPLLSVTTV